MDANKQSLRADAPAFVPQQKTPTKLNPSASQFVPRSPPPQQAYPPFPPPFVPNAAYVQRIYQQPANFSLHHQPHSPISNSPLGPRPNSAIPIEPRPALSPAHSGAKEQTRTLSASLQAQAQLQSTDIVARQPMADSPADNGAPASASPQTPTPVSVPQAEPEALLESDIQASQPQATAAAGSPIPVHEEVVVAAERAQQSSPVAPVAEASAHTPAEASTGQPKFGQPQGEEEDSYNEDDDPDYVDEEDDEEDEEDDEDVEDVEDDGDEDDVDSPSDSPNKPRKYLPSFMRQLKDDNVKKPSDLDLSCIVSEPRNRGGGGGAGRERGDKERGDRDKEGGRRDKDRNRNGWGKGQGRPALTPIPTSNAPVEPLQKSENAWGRAPPGSKEEEVVRTVRSILNKIAPDSFERLTQQILALDLSEDVTLQGVIDLLFDKAVMENNFVTIYANLSKCISESKDSNFRKLLINKCQMEFEAEAQAANSELSAQDQLMEARLIKVRMLGNIRFIGELYKLGLLNAGTMKICISTLLKEAGKSEEEEDLEALCRLLSTIGTRFEHENRETTIATLQTLRQLSEDATNKLTQRIRFLIMDLGDLHSRQWVPKQKASGPKKKAEIHKEIAMEEQRAAKDRDRDKDRSDRGDRRHDRDRDRPTERDRRGPGDVRNLNGGARQHSGLQGERKTQDARAEGDWTPVKKIARSASDKKTFGGTPMRPMNTAQGAKKPTQPIKAINKYEVLDQANDDESDDNDEHKDDEGDDDAGDKPEDESPQSQDEDSSESQTDQTEEDEAFVTKCQSFLAEYFHNRKDGDLELDLGELPTAAGAKFFAAFFRHVTESTKFDPTAVRSVMKLAFARFRKPALCEGLTAYFVGLEDFIIDSPTAPQVMTRILGHAVTDAQLDLSDLDALFKPLRQFSKFREVLGGMLQVVRAEVGEVGYNEKMLFSGLSVGSLLGLKKKDEAKFFRDFKLE